MASTNKLAPPKKIGNSDPGARDLESDSDEHFSDAQSVPVSPASPVGSPVPRLRVEKISTEPSYGEIPGTEAYALRIHDAKPDEIAVITDHGRQANEHGLGSSEGVKDSALESPKTQVNPPSPLPGGRNIPWTLLEEPPAEASPRPTDEDRGRPASQAERPISSQPSSSQPSGSQPSSPRLEELERRRRADAPPDLVRRSDGGIEVGEELAGLRNSLFNPDVALEETPNWSADVTTALNSTISTQGMGLQNVPNDWPVYSPQIGQFSDHDDNQPAVTAVGEIHTAYSEPKYHTRTPEVDRLRDADVAEAGPAFDGLGDDFDDFEEGAQGADFVDFGGDVFQQPALVGESIPSESLYFPYPVPDFDGLEPDEITSVISPYLAAIFPPPMRDMIPDLPPLGNNNDQSVFLTPRSASLWSQLIAPPPLAPPNWIRSRIRRLFLVSLGVPVDLDEILPASKQKKLMLPSVLLSPTGVGGGSSRLRTRSRANSDTEAENTGDIGTARSRSSRNHRGHPPVPELDLVSARRLCTTTEQALAGMTIAELRDHVSRLDELGIRSKEVLEYWQARTDEKIGDRDAFEGVIENLVRHARKVRM